MVPAITGRAWITGFHQLVVDPADPLGAGFKLADTWGAGRRGRLAQRGLTTADTASAPGAVTRTVYRFAAFTRTRTVYVPA